MVANYVEAYEKAMDRARPSEPGGR